MSALLLATRNEHKLRELREALPGVKIDPLPSEVELPPEEGETFAENALGKARAAHAATGRTAIADDSGIEAYGLAGRPGVRSARYAGEDATDEENLAKLLEEVGAQQDRRVAYVCAIALADEDGSESLFEGRCEGTLARDPRGSGGFGYDPAFLPDDTGPDDERTMAELA
ncbi:MAG: non-canonical purine NTP pyrophosphatase, partial [Solirubrobacterales bacterium]